MSLLELYSEGALWLLDHVANYISPSRLSMTFGYLPFASLRSGSIGRCLVRVDQGDDCCHVLALAIHARDAVTVGIFDCPIWLDLKVEEGGCNLFCSSIQGIGNDEMKSDVLWCQRYNFCQKWSPTSHWPWLKGHLLVYRRHVGTCLVLYSSDPR